MEARVPVVRDASPPFFVVSLSPLPQGFSNLVHWMTKKGQIVDRNTTHSPPLLLKVFLIKRAAASSIGFASPTVTMSQPVFRAEPPMPRPAFRELNPSGGVP